VAKQKITQKEGDEQDLRSLHLNHNQTLVCGNCTSLIKGTEFNTVVTVRTFFNELQQASLK